MLGLGFVDWLMVWDSSSGSGGSLLVNRDGYSSAS